MGSLTLRSAHQGPRAPQEHPCAPRHQAPDQEDGNEMGRKDRTLALHDKANKMTDFRGMNSIPAYMHAQTRTQVGDVLEQGGSTQNACHPG